MRDLEGLSTYKRVYLLPRGEIGWTNGTGTAVPPSRPYIKEHGVEGTWLNKQRRLPNRQDFIFTYFTWSWCISCTYSISVRATFRSDTS
jgi:hypothetical protein